MTHNGHKNWNHWNVALWFSNDESLYRLGRTYVHAMGVNAAARYMLDNVLERTTPDGAPYSLAAVKAALRGIT